MSTKLIFTVEIISPSAEGAWNAFEELCRYSCDLSNSEEWLCVDVTEPDVTTTSDVPLNEAKDLAPCK